MDQQPIGPGTQQVIEMLGLTVAAQQAAIARVTAERDEALEQLRLVLTAEAERVAAEPEHNGDHAPPAEPARSTI